MLSTDSGRIRLFRVAGIQVYLHWSWLLVAWFFITARAVNYRSMTWGAVEYLSLFAIVLLHEFGHAFACRQTGGKADEIVLWPLGGVAYVRPPPRPGAELWSIAAGPLVNVALVPLLWAAILTWMPPEYGRLWMNPERLRVLWPLWSDAIRFLVSVWFINLGLLTFNLLPIYPLDGGQIFRSLLWFKLSAGRSLSIATLVGFVGIPAAGYYAYTENPRQWLWILFMGGFVLQQCIVGFKHAQRLLKLEGLPQHAEFSCPSCRRPPPGGPLWRCGSCGNGFDPFSTRAVCPHCQAAQGATLCPHCGTAHPLERWSTARWDDGLPPVTQFRG